MKTIGLIGGMSWESSAEYYRLINEEVKNRLGGLHSAQILMYSVDFDDIEGMQHAGRWHDAGRAMNHAAQRLERGGSDFIVLCTNTMHKVADAMMEGIRIPLVHIADATGKKIKAAGLTRVGLLGTRFTMEDAFYRDRLIHEFALDVLVPEMEDRKTIHRINFEELCLGHFHSHSRSDFVRILGALVPPGFVAIVTHPMRGTRLKRSAPQVHGWLSGPLSSSKTSPNVITTIYEFHNRE